MSNPSDSDKNIDDSNKVPLPATPKGKQRAVGLPTTPRLDRRNPDLVMMLTVPREVQCTNMKQNKMEDNS